MQPRVWEYCDSCVQLCKAYFADDGMERFAPTIENIVQTGEIGKVGNLLAFAGKKPYIELTGKFAAVLMRLRDRSGASNPRPRSHSFQILFGDGGAAGSATALPAPPAPPALPAPVAKGAGGGGEETGVDCNIDRLRDMTGLGEIGKLGDAGGLENLDGLSGLGGCSTGSSSKGDLEHKSTALIFSSGKMVVTGSKTMEDSRYGALKYTKMLKDCGVKGKSHLRLRRLTTQNVVAKAYVQEEVDLSHLVNSHGSQATWVPELFPGVIFRPTCSTMVYLIFESGHIVATGGRSVHEIFLEWRRVVPLVLASRCSAVSASQAPPETRSSLGTPNAESLVGGLQHQGKTAVPSGIAGVFGNDPRQERDPRARDVDDLPKLRGSKFGLRRLGERSNTDVGLKPSAVRAGTKRPRRAEVITSTQRSFAESSAARGKGGGGKGEPSIQEDSSLLRCTGKPLPLLGGGVTSNTPSVAHPHPRHVGSKGGTKGGNSKKAAAAKQPTKSIAGGAGLDCGPLKGPVNGGNSGGGGDPERPPSPALDDMPFF